jgi:hypothetical protein
MEDNKQTTQPAGTVDAGKQEVATGKTFTQDQLNEIVSQRVKDVQAKQDETVKNAVAQAIAEERRQAKLTEEEREKEAKTRREAELKAREDDLTLRENKIKAQEMLSQKNIPIDLVDFVVDLDADKTKENIEKLAKTYNKSVETGVTDKLKGTPPTDFSNSNKNTDAEKTKKVYSAF